MHTSPKAPSLFLRLTTLSLLVYALFFYFILHTLTPSNRPPLVSLILTTHNVHPYLPATLSSILSQTYSNIELIVIDDGSTDNTTHHLLNFTKKYGSTFIPLSSATVGGVGTPSNLGIDRATGEYLLFLDGDDIAMPDFVTHLVNTATRTKADIAYCSYRKFRRDPSNADTGTEKSKWYWPGERVIARSQLAGVSPTEFRAFDINPVPWRKIYKLDFLRKYGIRFPEGDYVFEDNVFHWLVTMYAKRVAFLPEPLVLHRIGRKGQSIGAMRAGWVGGKKGKDVIKARLKGGEMIKLYANQNYIGYRVLDCPKGANCQLAKDRFLNWVRGCGWVLDIVKRSGNDKVTAKMTSIKYRMVKYWQERFGNPRVPAAKKVVNPDLALSIVVPVLNGEEFLPEFVSSLLDITVENEVIFVDDNSTDETLTLLKALTDPNDNMHILSASGKGAGRARNYGLMFSEGRYVISLDVDDVVDPSALDSAVRYAISKDVDVLMLKYEIEHVRGQTSSEGSNTSSPRGMSDSEEFEMSVKGMSDSDFHLWKRRSTTDPRKRKILAAKLTHYPWNKIVKRELLLRKDIFFGATAAHSDIQFHWHTIFTSSSVDFFDVAVVRHRMFEDKVITNWDDGLTLSDALALTNRAMLRHGLVKHREFRNTWRKTAMKLIQSEKQHNVNGTYNVVYDRKTKALMKILNSVHAKADLIELDKVVLPHWYK